MIETTPRVFLYTLDEAGDAVPEPDALAWGRWFETADRAVKRETIGDSKISTVFLGTDHGFGFGPPVLWETMIFGGLHDGWSEHATSREGALTMHALAVRVARGDHSE